MQPVGHPEGVLAADRDQRVDAEVAQVGLDPLDPALDLVRVGPRGAEDGAAARQDAADLLDVQRHGLALQRAAPAVPEADELVPVDRHALADDGADDRVEAGAVAAAGEHADPHASHPTATARVRSDDLLSRRTTRRTSSGSPSRRSSWRSGPRCPPPGRRRRGRTQSYANLAYRPDGLRAAAPRAVRAPGARPRSPPPTRARPAPGRRRRHDAATAPPSPAAPATPGPAAGPATATRSRATSSPAPRWSRRWSRPGWQGDERRRAARAAARTPRGR